MQDDLKDLFLKKLIDTKQRWAKDGRLLTGKAADPKRQRLPPGQHEVRNWPVLDLGHQPLVALKDWRLVVDGLVENRLAWDWEGFRAQPRVTDVSDIHCVTSWSRFDNHWEGVAAQHLLTLARPTSRARHVIFHSHDNYTTNVPLADFADADVLLADTWEGKPIPREHGGPMRIIIPKLYFWKSAKWVKRIEFIADDKPGFWENRGYHNYGDPWREQRYDRDS